MIRMIRKMRKVRKTKRNMRKIDGGTMRKISSPDRGPFPLDPLPGAASGPEQCLVLHVTSYQDD